MCFTLVTGILRSELSAEAVNPHPGRTEDLLATSTIPSHRIAAPARATVASLPTAAPPVVINRPSAHIPRIAGRRVPAVPAVPTIRPAIPAIPSGGVPADARPAIPAAAAGAAAAAAPVVVDAAASHVASVARLGVAAIAAVAAARAVAAVAARG